MDADRDVERNDRMAETSVLNIDDTGAEQQGERKTLPFLTKKITSAGKITISSNKNIEFDCKINGVAYDYKVYTANGETRNLTLDYLFNHPDVTLVVATTVINE